MWFSLVSSDVAVSWVCIARRGGYLFSARSRTCLEFFLSYRRGVYFVQEVFADQFSSEQV